MECETTIRGTVERLRTTYFNIEPYKNAMPYRQRCSIMMALEWKHAEDFVFRYGVQCAV